jgi:DNA-3-methyladenine glycosylase II
MSDILLIKRHLGRDAILGQAIESIELPALELNEAEVYVRLLRAIVYQQLSGKAATTIHGRFLDLFPERYPHPEQLLALPEERLRLAGLSRQKAAYLRNAAEHFLLHPIPNWQALSDEEILAWLTAIKGVGRWTVEMILIFTLGRPDVFPVDDLGVRQAIVKLYQLEEQGSALLKACARIAEPWRPYRSYATRWLWRWLDS